jgi:transposase
MRADLKECPECNYVGEMEYQFDEADIGIFGRGWVCPECQELIEDDTDESDFF